MANEKIAVLTPYFGAVDYEHWLCVERLMQKAGAVVIRHHGCPYVDMSRAYLAQRALDDTEADIFFWIDHDMLFKVKDVFALAERCRDSKYDVLAAAYSTKKPKGRIIGGFQGETVTFYEPGLYDSDSCGFGFTAVKRHVFERLLKTIPKVYCPAVDAMVHPFFAHEIDDIGYFGEDISFVRRVRRAGMTIGMDAEPRLYHRGIYNYALEDTGIAVPRYESLKVHNDPTPEKSQLDKAAE